MTTRCRMLVQAIALALLVLGLGAAVCWAAEPTLARLAFWVPPDRMVEFESAYQEKVLPILEAHGLTTSAKEGRTTVDSVFSRLFELESPSQVPEARQVLQEDEAFQAILQGLGLEFGAAQPDTRIRFAVRIYATPAGPGTSLPAGPGRATPVHQETGVWRMSL